MDSGMPDFATFKRCRLSVNPLTAGPYLLHAHRGGKNCQVTVTDGQRNQSPSCELAFTAWAQRSGHGRGQWVKSSTARGVTATRKLAVPAALVISAARLFEAARQRDAARSSIRRFHAGRPGCSAMSWAADDQRRDESCAPGRRCRRTHPDDRHDVLRSASGGLDALGGPVKAGADVLPASLVTAPMMITSSACDHSALNGPGRPSTMSPSACWHRDTKRSQSLSTGK
jgi:hypothetical protein